MEKESTERTDIMKIGIKRVELLPMNRQIKGTYKNI